MRVVYLFVLLLLGSSVFAQSNNLSVVSIEKLNIVYSSIPNPIKIAVPGAKSFTAKADGLVKIDSLGNYTITPRISKEVVIDIEAEMCDGTLHKEQKVLKVKGLPALTGVLNAEPICRYCRYEMKKEELAQVQVDVIMEDVLIFTPNDKYFEVKEFTVKIHQTNGKEETTMKVTGNRFSEVVLDKIRDGSFLIVDNIKFKAHIGVDMIWKGASPITITINEY